MRFSASSPAVLFLQGPASVFWRELAEAFEARGARVLHVRLSASDHILWRRPGAISYRGTLADWPAYLDALIEREGIGDIVLYADRRPYHAAASQIAAARGIGCHVIENGYLRPDWITLERGGMGGFSHFPADPETIRTIARDMPDPDFEVRYGHAFSELAFNEVVAELANRFDPVLHPHYDADRYYDPLIEFLSWLPRSIRVPRLRREADRVEAWDPATRFWLLGMQLQSDYQIRVNSRYHHLSEMLDEVISSFAAHAEAADRLVVKLHPHDSGLEHWDRVVRRIAAARGVGGRIHLVMGGDLGRLLARTQGVVLVNSTVGLHALRAGRPLAVLGAAVYDMPGLTHQGSLDTFWTASEPPDPELVRDLFKALAGTIQIKGDFYDPAGRAVAVATIADRVLAGRVNEPGAYVDPPPRLARLLAERAAAGKPDASR